MTDDRFEREMRDLLARRDPGPVPERLRARIAAVPNENAGTSGIGRLGRLGGVLQLAAAAVVIVGVVATAVALRNVGPSVGALAPVGVPLVDAPEGLFSIVALQDAEARLAAVARETGLHAQLAILGSSAPNVIPDPGGSRLAGSTEAEGSGRDLVQVLGVDDAGQVTCCMTRMGWAVREAQAYWRVGSWTERIQDGFEHPDPVERDATLAAWVRGIEDLGMGVARDATRFAEHRSWWFVVAAVALGVLGLAAVVLLRWGRLSADSMAPRRALLVIAACTAVGIVPVAMSLPPTDAAVLSTSGPGIDGQGFVAFGPDLVSAPFLLAGLAGIGWTMRRLRRRAWALPILLCVALASTWWLASRAVPGPEVRHSAYVIGDGLEADPTTAGGIGRWARTTGGPDDTFFVGFDVANTGPMPITIRGLQGAVERPGVVSWVGLGYRSAGDDLAATGDRPTRPFHPVRIAPGERLFLVLEGRLGRCAVAKADAGPAVLTVPQPVLAWDVLGWSRRTELGPPATLLVPIDPTCPLPPTSLRAATF